MRIPVNSCKGCSGGGPLMSGGVHNMGGGLQPVIDACRSELAMNFECPAERILGFYGAKLGMSSKEMDELLRSLIA